MQDEQKKQIAIAAGAIAAVGLGYLAYKVFAKPAAPAERSARRVAPKVSTSSTTGIVEPTTPVSPSQINNVFAASAGVSADNWKTYVSEALGFSLEYPSEFAEPEIHNGPMGQGYLVMLGLPNQSPTFAIAIEQIPAVVALDDIVDQQLQMMQMMMMAQGFVKLIERKNKNVNNLEGRCITLEVRPPNTPRAQRLELIMLQKQNRVFTIRLEPGKDKKDSEMDKRILESIKAVDLPSVGTLTFCSFRNNIKIDLPSVDFKIKSNDGDDHLILSAQTEDAEGTAISGIKVTSHPVHDYNSTLELFAQNRIEKIGTKSGFEDKGTVTIAGAQQVEARVLSYLDRVGEREFKIAELLFIVDTHSFIVSLFAIETEFTRFFEKALESIKQNLQVGSAVSGAATAATASDEQADVVTYRNGKYNFSIDVEQDFLLTEHLLAEPILSIVYQKQGDKSEFAEPEMFQTTVSLEDLPAGTDSSVENVRSRIKKEIQKGAPGAVIKKDEIVKVNGRDAVHLVFHAQDPYMGMSLAVVVLAIPQGTKLFTVKTQTSVEALNAELQSKIDTVHKSVKLL